MRITVDLDRETYGRLVEQARAHKKELLVYAADVLKEAATASGVAAPKAGMTSGEIRAWLDGMAQFSDQIPPMPGETFTREMIYRDHD